MTAVGLLLALMLAQRTARSVGVAPAQAWNLCVVALFAALVGSRLLLVIVNWREIAQHPLWVFGLAMVHHPLLIAAAGSMGGFAALLYARWQHMPLRSTADALAAPIMLGAAFEQLGALLAGSGYGTETSVPWAVVYTHPLAARWSGAPLGVDVHPVQAYAALVFLTLTILLLVMQPMRRQQGDLAGVALMGGGAAVFATEIWRDWEGRGAVLRGALDGPQIAAIMMAVCGALLLLERKSAKLSRAEGSAGEHSEAGHA